MDNRAIGIFDSGLGGLTAVAALRRIMPDENIVYFADSARVPYGGRSAAELELMARQDLELMASFSAKAVIAACGTVSSNAPHVLSAFPMPVCGVLEPAVQAMAAVPGSGPLAIIATEASIRSGAFARALEKAAPGREVTCIPCPDFVPLIESGHTLAKDPLLRQAVEKALGGAAERGLDALLLGCTHYGIIADAIGNFLGSGVRLVSAADCAAETMAGMIRELGIAGGQGQTRYLTSGPAESFSAAASALLGREIRAEHIEPMEVKIPC